MPSCKARRTCKDSVIAPRFCVAFSCKQSWGIRVCRLRHFGSYRTRVTSSTSMLRSKATGLCFSTFHPNTQEIWALSTGALQCNM
eukprot:1908750-Amphidinium_carterae.1